MRIRVVASVLIGCVMALIAPSGAASASAQRIGACTTTSGVILAVDFSHFGGSLLRACGSTPTTGYKLLNEGGWHTDGDNHDGPAFICRIGFDGYHGGTRYPTAKQEPCILTPPASAYWSYWHADPGQKTWSYSQLGAMSYRPKPGSVDLWVFGGTNIAGTTGSGVPRFSPDSVQAHNTAPTGGVTPKKPITKPTGATTQPAQPTSGSNGDPVGAGTQSTAATGASTDTGAISAPPAAAAPSIVDVNPTSDAAQTSHGSATPAIVALVIVLLLGAAGTAFALRRPSRDESNDG